MPINDVASKLPPFRPAPADPAELMRQNAASTTIARGMRTMLAAPVYTRMTTTGRVWQGPATTVGPARIRQLSDANIARSRMTLGILTPAESKFLAAFLKMDFYATHTTIADIPKGASGTLGLYSRQELVKRGIPFNEEDSFEADIITLANDGMVFFSLEAGSKPKKPSSNFGSISYRFNLNDGAFRDVGWLTLVDQLFPITPEAGNHVKYLKPEENAALANRRLEGLETIYKGRDMKLGLGLAVLTELRTHLTPESQMRALESRDEFSINSLLNGLFRPEVKVPRHFFSRSFHEATILHKKPMLLIEDPVAEPSSPVRRDRGDVGKPEF